MNGTGFHLLPSFHHHFTLHNTATLTNTHTVTLTWTSYSTPYRYLSHIQRHLSALGGNPNCVIVQLGRHYNTHTYTQSFRVDFFNLESKQIHLRTGLQKTEIILYKDLSRRKCPVFSKNKTKNFDHYMDYY